MDQPGSRSSSGASLPLPSGPMRTLNERSRASHPGAATLSLERLALFHPYLATGDATAHPEDAAFFATLGRESGLRALTEHLAYGDCRAAVVAAVTPDLLLIAAYSDDFDACVFLLAGPATTHALSRQHHLVCGSRLITCNTYLPPSDDHHHRIQDDIAVGRLATGCPWSGVWPVIVDFLTDDERRLSALHAGISSREWNRATELAFADHPGGLTARLIEPFRSNQAGRKLPPLPGADRPATRAGHAPYGDAPGSRYEAHAALVIPRWAKILGVIAVLGIVRMIFRALSNH